MQTKIDRALNGSDITVAERSDRNLCIVEGANSRKKPNAKKFLTNPERKIIKINVAGKIFDADLDVLNKFPNTLLGNPQHMGCYYDRVHQEYFLDRHRDTFQVILDFYYRGGTLRRPDDIPIDIFINELKFYKLSRSTLEEFLREEGILHVEVPKEQPRGKIRKYIWGLFEGSDGSLTSKIITIISALVIAISVVVFCLETLKNFRPFSLHSKHFLEMGLNKCQQINQNQSILIPFVQEIVKLNSDSIEPDVVVLNKSNNGCGFFVIRHKVYLLISALTRTLLNCQKSVSMLSIKFAFEQCLLELYDQKENLKTILNINKTTKIKIATEKKCQEQTSQELKPMLLHKIDNKKSKEKNQKGTENINSSISFDKEEIFVSRSFTFETCLLLNNKSTRTRYEWLVVEGLMGSKGGILFIIESSCILWFVTEFLLRFFSAPNKKKFMKVSPRLKTI